MQPPGASVSSAQIAEFAKSNDFSHADIRIPKGSSILSGLDVAVEPLQIGERMDGLW